MLTQALTLTLHLKCPNQHILCPWTSWKSGRFVRARKCCSYLQYELHLLLRARLAEDIAKSAEALFSLVGLLDARPPRLETLQLV